MIDGVLQLDLPRSDAPHAPHGMLPSFVIGPENGLLAPPLERLLASDDLAEAARIFNPLVLVGPAGSGKSHIAQGLVRRWGERLELHEVAYFTAADFGRAFQAAQADERLVDWRRGIRALRLLVIESLDRLRPRTTIQQELRACIDALVENGAVIVSTAQREPAALNQLDLGLRDRLAAGLTVRLQRPRLAARRTLLELAAKSRGLSLTENELSRLARRDAGAPAQLLGKLALYDRSASGSLRLVGKNGEGDKVSDRECLAMMKQIIAVTARYFAVTQAALTGPSRRTSLVQVRNIIVHLARQLTSLSYAEIGRALGGRDHTTIIHADRCVAERLADDGATQQAVDELDRLLRN